jgi:hypothetical protein
MALTNRMSLRPGLLWLILNLALIIQCLSWNNIFIIFFNFTYPLRCLRVPQVEYHCARPHAAHLAVKTMKDTHFRCLILHTCWTHPLWLWYYWATQGSSWWKIFPIRWRSARVGAWDMHAVKEIFPWGIQALVKCWEGITQQRLCWKMTQLYQAYLHKISWYRICKVFNWLTFVHNRHPNFWSQHFWRGMKMSKLSYSLCIWLFLHFTIIQYSYWTQFNINTLSLPLEAGGTPCWKVEPKMVTGGLCCCPYTTVAIPIGG